MDAIINFFTNFFSINVVNVEGEVVFNLLNPIEFFKFIGWCIQTIFDGFMNAWVNDPLW